MWSRPESDEALVTRLLPSRNGDRTDRLTAWNEWQRLVGERSLLSFIRLHNNTGEPDEDLLQEALLTAYLEVERGRYEPRRGIPFTAYVKGIARNKIREARRRERHLSPLDDLAQMCADGNPRQLEAVIERHEERQALRCSMDGLSAQRRQVLERVLAGDSTGEIARKLDITEDLVRQHKSRAVRSLRGASRLNLRPAT